MIRDVGFLSWKQPSAWMESMKGSRWNSMVEKENKRFKDYVKKSATKEELLQKANDFSQADKTIFFRYESLLIKPKGSSFEWFHEKDMKQSYTASDIFVDKNYIYTIRDVGEGSQKYKLECLHDSKVLWSKENVGPEMYVKDNVCYYLTAKKRLWYNSVECVDSTTGNNTILIYEELDEKFQLSFVKGENCLFLLRENSGLQNMFVIDEKKIVYENTKLQYYYPIGYHKKKLCYFYSNGSSWKSKGFSFEEFEEEIEYFSLKNKLFLLRESGKKTMYNLHFKKLYSFYGDLILNRFVENPFTRFFIDFTNSGIQEMNIVDETVIMNCTDSYASTKRFFTKNVPIVCAIPCKIKALLVIAYGAYGLPTSFGTSRWKPYIDDGWLIAFVCVRGSGDVTKRWAEEGRAYKKENSCIDLEEGIQYIQQKFHISAKNTCIYGRSAGGYLVGATIARNPRGNLFKMAYTEVPYVDVLRTTTNPDLPLTTLEYDEFGNPRDGIFQFKKILELSPVDLLNPPDIDVLIRVSENDSQVYAYEGYKWLEALKGRGILYSTKNKGHFVRDSENFSEDFFIINYFRENVE